MSDASFRIDADVSPYEDAMRRATAASASSTAQIKEQFEQLNSTFASFGSSLTSLFTGGAVGAAIASVGAEIEKLGGRAVQMITLAEAIGVSTDQFQAMSVAADRTGVGIEMFTRAGDKLAETLNKARAGSGAAVAALRELGVSTEQIASPTFGVNELLGLLRDRLNNASTATETHNALLNALGPRAARVEAAIKAYDGSLQGVAGTMTKVGGLSKEELANLQETKAAWDEVGTHIVNSLSGALVWIKKVNDETKSDSNLGEWLVAAADKLAHPFQSLQVAAFTPPPPAAAPAPDQTPATNAAREGAAEQIAAGHSVTEETLRDIKEQIAATAAGSDERLALVKKLYADSLEFYGSKNVDAVRAAHAEMLTAERELSTKRKDFLESWGAEYQRISTRIVESQMESDTRLAQAVNEVEKQKAEVVEINALARVEANEKALAEALRAGDVSAGQFLAQERALLQQRLAIIREYWQARTNGAVEIAKADAQALVQEQEAENKARQASLAQWKSLAKGIENAMDQAVGEMLSRNKSFTQSMRSMFAAMGEDIIKTLIKVAVQNEINAMIARATGQAAAKSNIMANAAQAASGAMASAAEIPYVGWILAPIAGAAVYAAALAFPMAERGYDIPGNVNPMVQAHAREMILPADLSERIRGMTDGGGKGAEVNHNYGGNTINVSDSSVKRLLQSRGNQRAFVEAMAGAYRRGARPR